MTIKTEFLSRTFVKMNIGIHSRIHRKEVLELSQNDEPVKLVIWDMDRTFWKGVISEEPISLIEAHINILKELVGRGIMNSICSHNSFKQVRDMLEDHQLWQFFVFPEINWSPKGKLIKKIIAGCKLRPDNVLFIDDEPSHLHEAEFENPGIRTCFPHEIATLIDSHCMQGKPDPEHTQLNLFKILERSTKSKLTAGSNQQFLKDSRISVELIHDCLPHLDRIHDMVKKTMQVNFTKKRMSKEEVHRLLLDPSIEKGCVRVRDRFGDYGISGFYAMKDHRLIHYLFSCRIMNMGIEQWVYHYLKFPHIDVIGTVASKLTQEPPPAWIHTVANISAESSPASNKIRCLMKGGCDLEQIQHYLNFFRAIDWESEFMHITENGSQLRNDHTEFIVHGTTFSPKELEHLTKAIPFFDKGMLHTSIFDSRFDVVVYSLLLDYKAGLYRPKQYPYLTLAFGSHYLPLNNEANFDLILERNFINMDKSSLQSAQEELEYIGPLRCEQLIQNLNCIREQLPSKTVLILVNGSEVTVWDRAETDMHLHHAKMNAALRQFADGAYKTHIIDVNDFINGPQDHTDSLTHYTRKVYKQIAETIVRIIEAECKVNIEMDKKDIREMKLLDTILPEFIPTQFF